MKKYLVLVIIILSSCSTIPYGEDYKRHAATIDQAITAIKIALGNVEKDLESSNLELTDAVLTLSTSYTEITDGKGSIFIIGGGKTSVDATTDKVVIKLTPIRPAVKITEVDMSRYLSERLTKAIASTVDGIAGASSGTLPLRSDSIEIEQGLSIKTTKTIGGEYKTEVIPVTIGASKKKESSTGHSLKVTLKPKAKK